jgi:hypothetical protein
MKKIVLSLAFLLVANFASAQLTSKDTNPEAMEVLNKFMEALMIADADKSAQEVMKYVHKSLVNDEGTDLIRDLRSFSFKKAHSNAKYYQIPVVVTRVRKTDKRTAIGYDNKAEAGRIEDYFVAKKKGANGLPAPVQIFFPADGGTPRIAYMGSL